MIRSTSILSWNVEGRLSPIVSSGRGSPAQIEAAILKINADIVVLPEALGWGVFDTHLINRLQQAGYKLLQTKYHDVNRIESARWNDPSIALLTKLSIIDSVVVRPGEQRNLLQADIEIPSGVIRLLAVHLEERSEARRQMMVVDILKFIENSPYPVCLAGDFNAMVRSDLRTVLLRLLPLRTSDRPHQSHFFRQLREVVEMASGATITRLESTAIRPADTSHAPTITPKSRTTPWLPSIPLFKIDHIYGSPLLKFGLVQVLADHGSDHRGLLTSVHYGS